MLVGQRLELLTRDGPIPGVVGKQPIHLLDAEERKKAPELKHLHIDIGAKDGDDARAMVRDRRRRGDRRRAGRVPERAARLALDGQPARLLRRLRGGAAGRRGRATPPADVCALAVTQEEITFAGARTTAFSLQPDLVIVVDVTFATDQPASNEKELGRHHVRVGPVLQRGSTLDPRDLRADARDRRGGGHPVHGRRRARARRAPTRTRIHASRGGIPTGVVSIPLRYMHSPVEMVQMDDVENTARLIAAFARRLEAGVSFER